MLERLGYLIWEKMRRIFSWMFDLTINVIVISLLRDAAVAGLNMNSTFESITDIIAILIAFVFFITKDANRQRRSLGKILFKFNLIKDNDSKPSIKETIIRNIISSATSIFNIIPLAWFNMSFGDIFLKTKVIEDDSGQKIKDAIKANLSYTHSARFYVITSLTTFFLIYVSFIYLFFQKINFNSLRFLIMEIVVVITIFFYWLLKKKGKSAKLLIVVFIIAWIEVYSEPFENTFIKSKSLDASFTYSFPQAKLIEKVEIDDVGFVFYKINKDYEITSFKKDNDIWQINIPEDMTSKKSYTKVSTDMETAQLIVEDFTQVLFYKAANTDRYLVVFQTENKFENVTDSVNSEFYELVYDDIYNYVAAIDKRLDVSYKIIADGKEYVPSFENINF